MAQAAARANTQQRKRPWSNMPMSTLRWRQCARKPSQSAKMDPACSSWALRTPENQCGEDPDGVCDQDRSSAAGGQPRSDRGHARRPWYPHRDCVPHNPGCRRWLGSSPMSGPSPVPVKLPLVYSYPLQNPLDGEGAVYRPIVSRLALSVTGRMAKMKMRAKLELSLTRLESWGRISLAAWS